MKADSPPGNLWAETPQANLRLFRLDLRVISDEVELSASFV
jgi:hypothetical protein